MKTFLPGQSVRINTPGEDRHDKIGYVTQSSTTQVWVAFPDVTWMYFHAEIDIVE